VCLKNFKKVTNEHAWPSRNVDVDVRDIRNVIVTLSLNETTSDEQPAPTRDVCEGSRPRRGCSGRARKLGPSEAVKGRALIRW